MKVKDLIFKLIQSEDLNADVIFIDRCGIASDICFVKDNSDYISLKSAEASLEG